MRYGENSLIAFMLTDLLGRQNYLIQGVRSGRNNKAALYQPMFTVDFVGLESPRLQMHRMKEAANGMPLRSIPFDVRKSTVSLFMAEVLYRLVRESEPNSPLFDFVLGSAATLDALDDDNAVANFHLHFLVRLSLYLGFYPGNEPIDGGWFDIEEGVFTRHEPSHRHALDPENSRILGALMTIDDLASLRLRRPPRPGVFACSPTSAIIWMRSTTCARWRSCATCSDYS